MVTGKTGYLDFSGANGFKVRVPYTQKYDIEGNYSILEVDGSVYSATYARVYKLEGTIAVAGSNAASMAYADGYQVNTNYNTGVWIPIKNSAGATAGPWESAQIQHDDEGKATATIAVNLKGYATAYQGNVGDTFTVSGSATVELATIPRASTIGATDANIGAVSMIAVDRKSSGFTHSIKYEFGSLSGYITSSGGVATAETKITNTSISFKVPTTFYAQIPNAKTGVCKLTIKTYSGTTQIGSDQTAQFVVTAAEPDCKPTVSGTVVDSNETTKALTGDESVLVRFKSNALCTIAATAKNSATIATKKIAGTAVDSSLTIEGIEAASVAFAAIDSRGYQNSATVEFTLIPYVKLTCNPADTMIDPGTGVAVMTVKGNYFNGSFGAKSNSLTLKYRIKPSGGSYGSYSTVTTTLSGNTYAAQISLSGLDYKTEYTVEVVVEDALTSLTKTATVIRSIPIADWGENDFAFNVPVKLNAEEGPTEDADAVPLKYLKSKWPAMAIGTEYETPEYWQGKVVYAKLINFGALPNATYKILSISSLGATNIICASATTSVGAFIPFNYEKGSLTYKMWLSADTSNVCIRTEHDASAETAVVFLKYTKT